MMKVKEMLDNAGFPDAKKISAMHGTSMPKAISKDRLLPKSEAEEYLAIAKAVGLDDDLGYLLDIRLREVLVEENIHVYDYDKVAAFLDAKIGNKWKWLPLRQLDSEEFPGGNWGHEVAGTRRVYGNQRYNRAIPLPVLLTVKKIAERIPEARFYVSGVDRDADPFLCVTTKLLHTYVVERWDEPDYRER